MRFLLILYIVILSFAFVFLKPTGLSVVTFSNYPKSETVSQLKKSSNGKLSSLEVLNRKPGLGKVSMLSLIFDYVKNIKNSDDLVMFIDENSIILQKEEYIIEKFSKFGADIVASGSFICQPDESLKDKFPKVKENTRRFIGNEGVIGRVSALHAVMKQQQETGVIDEGQYWLVRSMLAEKKVANISVDSLSQIFQNLDNSSTSSEINFVEGEVENAVSHLRPAVLQAAGNTILLNNLANYIMPQPELNLKSADKQQLPLITLAVFIDKPTPFLSQFLDRLSNLTYNKQRINLVVSNLIAHYESELSKFVAAVTSRAEYSSVQYWSSTDSFGNAKDASNKQYDLEISKLERRRKAVSIVAGGDSEFLAVLEANVQLIDRVVLQKLVLVARETGRNTISPLLTRRDIERSLWSNFWGDVSPQNYYKRSWDYVSLVTGELKGVWNVATISGFVLLHTDLITIAGEELYGTRFDDGPWDEPELLLSANLRHRGNLPTLWNGEIGVGYVVNQENTTTEHLHNDLWEVITNPLDWEDKYIHPDYWRISNESFPFSGIEQPCTDVFWWPFLTETFAKQLIEEMENFGNWSSGSNVDTRLEGGYENVPTRDIHTRQINWEDNWIYILRKYVYPMQLKLLAGYRDIPSARMCFVVRYRPTEQDRLRPHHDASDYTLNIALNKPGVDYQGGGTHFRRYNCSIIDSRIGWTVMSPGRVTHLHEGLPTTSGTRYIFITFVNP